MARTQIQTCALCRLRFANGPLRKLHIREGHVQRNHQAPRDRSNFSDSGTSQPHARDTSRRNASASGLPPL